MVIVALLSMLTLLQPAYAYSTIIYYFGDGSDDVVFGKLWNKDPLNVFIINYTGKKKYEVAVKQALYDWSYWLKVGSNSTNFNFDIKEKGNIDIVIKISNHWRLNKVGTAGCVDGWEKRCTVTIYSRYITFSEKALKIYVKPMSKGEMYSIAAHEIGHALGLGHTIDENMKEPIDIMEQATWSKKISALDIMALLWLYGDDGFGGENAERLPLLYSIWTKTGAG